MPAGDLLIATAYPTDLLRKKLIIAGVPERDHSPEALVARMPADLDAACYRGLPVDMLAELLLYFIAKNFVATPVPAERALLDMPWGSHVCQFYNRKKDLLDMLVPYFQQALENNEACAWLVAELTVEEARSALAAAVPGLDEYIAKGQMIIRHYTELYTNPDGTVKPADELTEQFVALGSAVRAIGFEGLRASGDVSWVRDEDSMARFMDYETKVNCAIQGSRITAVCTYPAEAAALHPCRSLIHNHGHMYVKRGEWVHDNSADAKRIESVFASLTGK